MCIAALPLLGAIVSVAQGVAGFAAASQQASEQNAYYEANRQAALAAYRDKTASINNNTLQEREAASQKLFQKKTEALVARSKAAASAGEAGVTGLSVAALTNDFSAQEGRSIQAIQTNFEIQKQKNMDEGDAAYHNTIGRINSVRQASKPSALPFILQGIGGALGSFKGAA